MTSLQPRLPFDYDSLDADTRQFVLERAERIHRLARMTAAAIVQIGKDLIEAKARLGHGRFLEWIDLEFEWKKSSAENFMNVAQNVKLPTVGNLEIDFRALYLIAAPKTPEPVRTEVIRRAEGGEQITHEAVVQLRKRYEETGELPNSAVKLIAMVADAKKDMQSLPTPAQARQQAIATGMHTLDNTNTYQPPMSKADQKQAQEDWDRVAGLKEFLRWNADALPASELAAIIHKRGWLKSFDINALTSAAERLNAIQEAILVAALQKILQEVDRRRKKNNEERQASNWNPDIITKRQQSDILDWIEAELQQIVDAAQPDMRQAKVSD